MSQDPETLHACTLGDLSPLDLFTKWKRQTIAVHIKRQEIPKRGVSYNFDKGQARLNYTLMQQTYPWLVRCVNVPSPHLMSIEL